MKKNTIKLLTLSSLIATTLYASPKVLDCQPYDRDITKKAKKMNAMHYKYKENRTSKVTAPVYISSTIKNSKIANQNIAITIESHASTDVESIELSADLPANITLVSGYTSVNGNSKQQGDKIKTSFIVKANKDGRYTIAVQSKIKVGKRIMSKFHGIHFSVGKVSKKNLINGKHHEVKSK